MRDLAGYHGKPPQIVWPNGARVAVSLVVNYEEGAELQVGDGDPRSEPMGEVISVVEPGTRDIGQEQIFAYGMRVGLWRFFQAFEQRGITATFFCCGRAVERTPELAAEITRRGHEAACHGWRWRPHSDYQSQEAESADLDRAIAAIEAATGERPVGFFCRGSESPWTRELLAERNFLYTSNAFDDDLPYRESARPQLLVLPYALDTNDMKFFHPNGFVRAREMVDYVGDGLAQLVEEARSSDRSAVLNIGFHLRICGRPARFRAVSGILDAIERMRDDVWVARRDQIATHFLTHHPERIQ